MAKEEGAKSDEGGQGGVWDCEPLDERATERFRAWLKEKAGGVPDCSFCGGPALVISDVIRFYPGQIIRGGDGSGFLGAFSPGIASLALVCDDCGFLLHFDARKIFPDAEAFADEVSGIDE